MFCTVYFKIKSETQTRKKVQNISAKLYAFIFYDKNIKTIIIIILTCGNMGREFKLFVPLCLLLVVEVEVEREKVIGIVGKLTSVLTGIWIEKKIDR